MEQSEKLANLAGALSKAQAEMKHAVKSSENPFFRSKYADLAGVVDACRPALAKYGLAVSQTTRIDTIDGKPVNILKTILFHESGESIEGEVVLRPMRQEKNAGWVASEDPQSIGSAMTYARRYALAAICGVATDDDDGNAASGKQGHPPAEGTPLPAVVQDDAIIAKFDAAKTFDEMQKVYMDIPINQRHGYKDKKEETRVRISKGRVA